MALFEGMPRSATAKALTECRVLTLSGDAIARGGPQAQIYEAFLRPSQQAARTSAALRAPRRLNELVENVAPSSRMREPSATMRAPHLVPLAQRSAPPITSQPGSRAPPCGSRSGRSMRGESQAPDGDAGHGREREGRVTGRHVAERTA